MRILILLPLLSMPACVTPIKNQQFIDCTSICEPNEGLKEVCIEPWKGQGCHCNNDTVVWYKSDLEQDPTNHKPKAHEGY